MLSSEGQLSARCAAVQLTADLHSVRCAEGLGGHCHVLSQHCPAANKQDHDRRSEFALHILTILSHPDAAALQILMGAVPAAVASCQQ